VTDIDPAAIMAAHEGHLKQGCNTSGTKANRRDHCEPYRLAEALATSEAKVARVEALAEIDSASIWRKAGSKVVRLEERRDGYTVTRSYVSVDDLRAALADQPEQVSP
jgi:hypothetical protein